MPSPRTTWVQFVLGVLAAAAVAGLLHAVTSQIARVPSPGLFYVLTVSCCGFLGGFGAALGAAAALALAAALVLPDHPFVFRGNDAVRVAALWVVLPTTAAIVGVLKARADRSLAASEARFEALFHSLPDAVLVVRGDRVALANDHAAMLFRAPSYAALVGTPVWRLIHADDHAHVHAYLADLARGVEPDRPFEHTAVALDGARFDAEATSVDFAAGAGAWAASAAAATSPPAGSARLVVVRDVTARKRLTRRVEDQVRDLSILHEVSRALLFGLRPGEIPEYLCALVVDRLGARTACMGDVCESDQRVTLSVARGGAAPPPPPPGGTAAAAGEPSALAVAHAKPVVCPDAASDPRAAGWRPWLAACGCSAVGSFPLMNAGQVVAVLNVCADDGFFTDDRQALLGSLANLGAIALSEARAVETVRRRADDLQLALDAGQMGVFDWDMTADRLTWDANHLRLFGVTAQAFGGTFDAFARCVHPEDLPEIEWAVHSAQQARIAYEQEFRVVWPDRTVHWVVARGRYQYDDAGRAVRMNGFVMDIDRRRTAEQTAREQREQLAHLLRLSLLNQLASGLAHEINQPLMAIANFAGAALQMHASGTLTPERCHEVVTEIHQQSQRAGEIVRRLRGFMAKRPAGHARDCDLSAVVADALALMQAEVAAKRVRTRVDLAERLPPVRIDPVQIQQVLVNLIQNAADAMDDTPPRDRLITLSTLGSVEQVIVRVADTGKGIAPADLPKLFDSFFSTKSYGMGLGLNISRSIIEAHGGTLTASNNPGGRGATFEFLLPLEGHA